MLTPACSQDSFLNANLTKVRRKRSFKSKNADLKNILLVLLTFSHYILILRFNV